MCRSKPKGGRRCNGVTHRPEYRSAYRKVRRSGGTPAEARDAGLAAVETAEIECETALDALIDQAADVAAAEHAEDEALLADVPEDLHALARLLLGGHHEARWGFKAEPIHLAGPEDLDRLAAALPGVVASPRPSLEAGSISGITIGAAVGPGPLEEDVVNLLPAADLAHYREERRCESQRAWSAIADLRISWSSPWTRENREARREYARRVVAYWLCFFDLLFASKPRIDPATAG